MTLKSAFKTLGSALKNNWRLAVVLFLMQAALVVLLAFINVKYQVAIASQMNTVINAVQSANFDENAINAGIPFVSDMGSVYAAIEGIKSNLWKLVGYQVFVFMTLGVAMGVLTHCMFKKQKILKLFGVLFARSAVFAAAMGIVVFVILRKVFESAAEAEQFSATTWMYAALAVFFVGGYFMLVSLALGEMGFAEGLKKAFVVGATKAHYMVGVIVFSLAFVFAFGYLLFLASNWAFALLVLSVLLFIASLSFFVINLVAVGRGMVRV